MIKYSICCNSLLILQFNFGSFQKHSLRHLKFSEGTKIQSNFWYSQLAKTTWLLFLQIKMLSNFKSNNHTYPRPRLCHLMPYIQRTTWRKWKSHHYKLFPRAKFSCSIFEKIAKFGKKIATILKICLTSFSKHNPFATFNDLESSLSF